MLAEVRSSSHMDSSSANHSNLLYSSSSSIPHIPLADYSLKQRASLSSLRYSNNNMAASSNHSPQATNSPNRLASSNNNSSSLPNSMCSRRAFSSLSRPDSSSLRLHSQCAHKRLE